ncbi:hypothetical protein BREVNS_1656 [Brevinematales bacterium NS]|jgi:hypothetical protein|nr:hypothetical protein BREVNS_1656 [Brevinematales bacterium NS]
MCLFFSKPSFSPPGKKKAFLFGRGDFFTYSHVSAWLLKHGNSEVFSKLFPWRKKILRLFESIGKLPSLKGLYFWWKGSLQPW